MAQKWEYKTILRTRKINVGLTARITIDDWDINITGQLPSLGDEGWELVTVSGENKAPGPTLTGITNEELWVFKRPKS